MIPAQIHAADPYRDLCVLSIDGIQGMLPPLIASADDLSPGEPVVLFGYPHANAGRHVLTRQTADVGARVLLSAGPGTSKNVVLNIQAQPGQSGSPVISAVTGRIAAVLVGSFVPGSGGGIRLGTIDPMTLHQTTHAVSAHYIQEMI
jgi:S1-C subfamily serine protease